MVCLFRRRDISGNLNTLADSNASEYHAARPPAVGGYDGLLSELLHDAPFREVPKHLLLLCERNGLFSHILLIDLVLCAPTGRREDRRVFSVDAAVFTALHFFHILPSSKMD